MKDASRAVARLLAGKTLLDIPLFSPCVLAEPSREIRWLAEEAYSKALDEAAEEGLLDDSEAEAKLREDGLWDEEKAEQLRKLPDSISSLKKALFKTRFRSNEKARLRKLLADARDRQSKLESIRHSLRAHTAEGYAAMARARYLLARSLRSLAGDALFPTDDSYWEAMGPFLDAAMSARAASMLGETQLRWLARNEPWRSVWSCRKHDSLFGIPAADLGDEQRSLVAYSSLYDSVWEHPECPPDEVVEDDDCLDGWLLVQREKRESGRSGDADALHPNSSEVYVVADTPEDARKVYSLNDPAAAASIRKRMAHVDRVGEVGEQDIPEARRLARERAMEQAGKGRG